MYAAPSGPCARSAEGLAVEHVRRHVDECARQAVEEARRSLAVAGDEGGAVGQEAEASAPDVLDQGCLIAAAVDALGQRAAEVSDQALRHVLRAAVHAVEVAIELPFDDAAHALEHERRGVGHVEQDLGLLALGPIRFHYPEHVAAGVVAHRLDHPAVIAGQALALVQLPLAAGRAGRAEEEHLSLTVPRDDQSTVGQPGDGLRAVAVREARLPGEQTDRVGAVLDAADPGAGEVQALLVALDRSRADRRREVVGDRDLVVSLGREPDRDAQGLEAQGDLDDSVQLVGRDRDPAFLVGVAGRHGRYVIWM